MEIPSFKESENQQFLKPQELVESPFLFDTSERRLQKKNGKKRRKTTKNHKNQAEKLHLPSLIKRRFDNERFTNSFIKCFDFECFQDQEKVQQQAVYLTPLFLGTPAFPDVLDEVIEKKAIIPIKWGGDELLFIYPDGHKGFDILFIDIGNMGPANRSLGEIIKYKNGKNIVDLYLLKLMFIANDFLIKSDVDGFFKAALELGETIMTSNKQTAAKIISIYFPHLLDKKIFKAVFSNKEDANREEDVVGAYVNYVSHTINLAARRNTSRKLLNLFKQENPSQYVFPKTKREACSSYIDFLTKQFGDKEDKELIDAIIYSVFTYFPSPEIPEDINLNFLFNHNKLRVKDNIDHYGKMINKGSVSVLSSDFDVVYSSKKKIIAGLEDIRYLRSRIFEQIKVKVLDLQGVIVSANLDSRRSLSERRVESESQEKTDKQKLFIEEEKKQIISSIKTAVRFLCEEKISAIKETKGNKVYVDIDEEQLDQVVEEGKPKTLRNIFDTEKKSKYAYKKNKTLLQELKNEIDSLKEVCDRLIGKNDYYEGLFSLSERLKEIGEGSTGYLVFIVSKLLNSAENFYENQDNNQYGNRCIEELIEVLENIYNKISCFNSRIDGVLNSNYLTGVDIEDYTSFQSSYEIFSKPLSKMSVFTLEQKNTGSLNKVESGYAMVDRIFSELSVVIEGVIQEKFDRGLFAEQNSRIKDGLVSIKDCVDIVQKGGGTFVIICWEDLLLPEDLVYICKKMSLITYKTLHKNKYGMLAYLDGVSRDGFGSFYLPTRTTFRKVSTGEFRVVNSEEFSFKDLYDSQLHPDILELADILPLQLNQLRSCYQKT